MSSGLRVNYRKWPDTPHWQFTVYPLGSDVHGDWFCLPDGSAIQRGLEPPQISRTSIMLLREGAWWVAFWNTDKTKAHELYVDVIKPVIWNSYEVMMIDLDLDVVRAWDGQIEILDRDEFELHQRTLQYPGELVETAEMTTELLAKAIRTREEPFGDVGNAWRTKAISRSWP
jgi:uncharacterized protein